MTTVFRTAHGLRTVRNRICCIQVNLYVRKKEMQMCRSFTCAKKFEITRSPKMIFRRPMSLPCFPSTSEYGQTLFVVFADNVLGSRDQRRFRNEQKFKKNFPPSF